MRGHHYRNAILFLVLVAAITTIAGRVRAGNAFCAHCGEAENCQKICRLVCENKKITTTCWGCATEDFCLPGPSTPNCRNCEMVCGDNSDPKVPCAQPKKLVWTDWTPGNCGKVYTKKKLMKRTVTKSVPSFKWVVEDLCAQCENKVEPVQVPPGTAIPPVPAVDAKVK